MLESSRWGHTGEGKEAGPSEQSKGTQHGQNRRGSQGPLQEGEWQVRVSMQSTGLTH